MASTAQGCLSVVRHSRRITAPYRSQTVVKSLLFVKFICQSSRNVHV